MNALTEKKGYYAGLLVQFERELSQKEAEKKNAEVRLAVLEHELQNMNLDKERIVAALGVISEIESLEKKKEPTGEE